MKYILSTMSNSVSYTFYNDGPANGIPTVKKTITVKGGANISSATSGFGELVKSQEGHNLWTPSGVITSLSDSDYDELMQHPIFKRHLDSGVVKPITGNVTGNHDMVRREANKMEKDNFAPMTPEVAKKKHAKVKTKTGAAEDDGVI